STSAAPAWRWRYESLPGWSTSNVWWACLMSDTRSPRSTKRGISFSMSVVFPLPDQPAKPKVFMRRKSSLHQHHFRAGQREHQREHPPDHGVGEPAAAVLGAEPAAGEHRGSQDPYVAWQRHVARNEDRADAGNRVDEDERGRHGRSLL